MFNNVICTHLRIILLYHKYFFKVLLTALMHYFKIVSGKVSRVLLYPPPFSKSVFTKYLKNGSLKNWKKRLDYQKISSLKNSSKIMEKAPYKKWLRILFNIYKYMRTLLSYFMLICGCFESVYKISTKIHIQFISKVFFCL